MKHPFEILKAEYSQLLSAMTPRPECRERINSVAAQILGHRDRFEEVSKINGVPVIFMGPSFYREAGLDFALNPAQGWPLRTRSKIIPYNGPFPDWKSAALEAYRLNGLDRVGAGKWTWELICFYGELFNGFGYRDYHHMHSPYLWGGTNIQTIGKYTEDGKFDESEMDKQLGIIPIAKRMAELVPALALPIAIPAPMPTGLATSADPKHNVTWLQSSLRELGYDLIVDGSYGARTRAAVHDFEVSFGLHVDGGYAGPEVIGAVEKALRGLKTEPAA
jgi:lysozyme family protein